MEPNGVATLWAFVDNGSSGTQLVRLNTSYLCAKEDEAMPSQRKVDLSPFPS